METTPIKIDPLRVLKMPEVIARTGYSRRKIMALVALDIERKTPGIHFAAPLQRIGMTKLEWRELTLIRWMERQEKQVA